MKINKRGLLLTLILAVVCVCTSFVLVCCGETPAQPNPEHEHHYTEWHYTDTEHWRECPDDGAATEKSSHSFVDGMCECGYADPREFGTVTGKVALYGGKNSADYSDVTVDFGGDDAIVDIDEEGKFAATHVTVGKAYDVTVSKTGYSSYTASIILETKDECLDLTKPFVLVYQRFESWQNKSLANFDLTHINDVDAPYIRSVANADLGVLTRESYDDVAVSVNFSQLKGPDKFPQKGLTVKFGDDKYMMLRIHNNKSLRWDINTWNQKSFAGDDVEFLELDQEQTEKFATEEGIKLTVVRKRNVLYVFLNDALVLDGTKVLSAEEADVKVQVGFWEYEPKADKVWKFDINENVSAYDDKIPSYAAPDLDVENGEVSFDKKSYKYGETATITMLPDTGYILDGLEIYGETVFGEVENNVYSFTVTGAIDAVPTFVEYELQNVTVTVNGIDKGETVKLSGVVTFTSVANKNDVRIVALTDGTAVVEDMITPGRYRVLYDDNYYGNTLVLAKGDTSATVELQYKRFDKWANGDLDRLDLSNINDAEPFIKTKADGDFGVISRDSYGDVSVSAWLSKVKDSGDQYPNKGVFVQFEDGKSMILRINYYANDGSWWLRWDKKIWNVTTVEDRETWIYKLNAQQEKKFFDESGIKLTLMRRGNMLYALLDDEFIYGNDGYEGNGIRELSAGYADDKVQVGLWEFAPKANKTYKFEIANAPIFAAPVVTATNGKVSFDKQSYKFGETATITLTPDTDYILNSLIVCGEDVKSKVKNNTYSFMATERIEVSATFAEYLLSDVTFTVNYAKLGVTAPLTGTIKLINTADETDVRTVAITNGTATVEDLVTPGEYKVVYADDYYDKTITLAKGATVVSVTLNYKRFEAWANGNLERLDLSQANGEQSSVTSVADGDLGVITRGDGYGDVTVSVWMTTVKDSGDKYPQKGVLVKFEDGKHMILRIHRYSDGTYWLCWNNNTWGQTTIEAEKWVCQLTETQMQKYNSEGGIKLTLLRRGNMLYAFLDDEYMDGTGSYAGNGTRTIDPSYADDKVQVGFWEFAPKANKDWKFEMEGNIPTFAAPAVTAENGAVTFDKPSYKYGETATITVTPATDYILSSLIVCGAEVKSQLNNNTYSFAATEKITASATFAECAVRDVTVTVNCAKNGTTEMLTGTVTLTNTADSSDVHEVALTDGTATVENLITPGEYKVVYNDDYYEGTIALAKGATTASVTLNYKLFEAWANGNLDRLDLSQANGAQPSVSSVADGDLGVITRGDGYGDVSVSVWMTSKNNSGDKYPMSGLLVKFGENEQMILRLHNYNDNSSYHGQQWLCWDKTGKTWGQTTLSQSDKWSNQKFTDDQATKFNSEQGVKLTLVRRGNMLYVLSDDTLVNELTMTLDAKYNDSNVKVQVGFWEFAPKANKTWKFEITTTLPDAITA